MLREQLIECDRNQGIEVNIDSDIASFQDRHREMDQNRYQDLGQDPCQDRDQGSSRDPHQERGNSNPPSQIDIQKMLAVMNSTELFHGSEPERDAELICGTEPNHSQELERGMKLMCGMKPIRERMLEAGLHFDYGQNYEAKRVYMRNSSRRNRASGAGFSKSLKRNLKELLFKLKKKRVFYIGGADVLPSPLNIDEEREYVAKLAQGDEEAKGVLIERNLRLVVYIAKKFENAGINVEDLISIGTIGLIKAVNTFNPDKNIKLATYASRCIENEILMFLRRNNKNKSEVSFDEPLNIDMDGNELLLSDILGTENDVVYSGLEEEINRKLLMQAMSKLSHREVQIIEMRFGLVDGDEMTQKEVADLLGISQSYISRLEKKIISKLRKEIKKLT